PDTLYWLVLAGSINLGIVISIIVFDADYMESELASAQRRYARLQQVRRGQFFAPKAKQLGRIWTLPDFPHLKGAGAIAWRQTTGTMRSMPTTLAVLPVLSIVAGVGINVSGLGEAGNIGIAVFVGVMAYVTLLISNLIQRNFRGDLEFMEVLKALPMPATAVVLGESVAPVLQLTYIHVAMSLVVVAGFEKPLFWASTLLVALPFNAAFALAHNLGFLLLPARVNFGNSGDIVAAGKQMISFLVVCAIILACLVVGFVFGAIAWVVFAQSWWAAQVGAAIGLWISVAVLVPITAGAFNNFDFSSDMPG
ncbi:MAG: putative ABC exporter domain-containing protein, partial [Candidatus Hydrogenedentes bacterium]|nr:putative ABC exporter domain-containing protein [Candidatus Hydrogenedentota bacterium]